MTTGTGSTRRRIVVTMATLLRTQGFSATGLNELVTESGTPKGSLYHHFPGGKDEVAAEALVFAGALVHATLEGLRHSEGDPVAALRAYGELLAGWMAESGYADGCPVTTTLLETTPANTRFADIGRDIFDAWQAVFASALGEAGVSAPVARDLALTAIMLLEGALIVARVRRDAAPIRLATAQGAALFERALRAR